MANYLLDDELKKEFETEWELEHSSHSDSDEGNSKARSNGRHADSNTDCAPGPEHLEVLSKCFGHKNFRPLQWTIINSIISERRDNCAIMSTGYGKSLCYQFPAVYTGGLVFVISPLISLMEDQVLAMQVSSISACLLGTANKKQKETIEEIFENKYSLVYLTPEFCTGEYGQDLLKTLYAKLSISLVAVDEAHCVSSWGHDFRHQYRKLGILKDLMPDVPILAVTATATQQVKDDIIETLQLRNPQITCSGFDRPNLYFSVRLKSPDILGDLRKVMDCKGGQYKFSGSTIIYCITRKQTEDISLLLNATGIKCEPYHAGLSLSQRKETHERFVKDKVDVIIATIAFGMGIDKPDVRNIIHYGASNSIEGYYQEVGRAGRDGLPATCTAFYYNNDFELLRNLKFKSMGSSMGKWDAQIDSMRDYLSTSKCRREFILSYFGDKKAASNAPCCDNCSDHQPDGATYEGLDKDGKYDFTKDAKTFLRAVNALNGRYGINMYVSFLRGSKMSKLSKFVKLDLHGSGSEKSEAWWKGIAILLEKEKYLEKERAQNRYSKCAFAMTTVCVSPKGMTFLKNEAEKLLLVPVPELLRCLKIKSNVWLSTTQNPKPLNPQPLFNKVREDIDKDCSRLYQLLMNKRYELATSQDCMPYSIASNTALMEMAKQKPITLEQFKKCQFEGFTETKIEKFGEEFIETIESTLNFNGGCKNEKMTIKDIISQHPMGMDKRLNPSTFTTHSLFTAGLSIKEIAQKRGMNSNIVESHLIDIMMLGYPVKLSDFEITTNIRDAVIDVIKDIDTGMNFLLPIKNACPPEITYNQIKAVISFLHIRRHLKDLNIPYIEFEDEEAISNLPPEVSVKKETSKSETEVVPNCEPSTSKQYSESEITPTQRLTNLLKTFDELEKSSTKSETDSPDEFEDTILAAACEKLESSFSEMDKETVPQKLGEDEDKANDELSSPTKSETGFDFSVLDSPPRVAMTQKRKIDEGASQSSEVEVKRTQSEKPRVSKSHSKKAKLPPWLTSQRIA
ncbi:hypothetical protein NQ315_010782 [Exocentrus adspersus]|uniref:DNA 3'-5' helicase n=1 Tax=Exocentrus adspersus TaxID=1586481 RepID=A0AAV8VUM4_9CUCU|nr:hypothetical protein NQ315_010782 [Exocentrus adspersus]